MASQVFETLSGWAQRHIAREQFERLRRCYLSAHAGLSPLFRLVYGSFDAKQLGRHLLERVGTNHEVLFVHSSTNHLQPMYTGTPLDLLKMLIEYCGGERTLAMPAFFFGDPGIGGAYETFQRRPQFDVRRTPSQMGLLTELFRRAKGVSLSRHPIYRIVALGPLAEELTRGHELAGTLCGSGTPFDFMARHETQIIGIGKPFEVLTQVHHAEDLMGDEFPVPTIPGAPRLHMSLIDGSEVIPFETSGRSFAWRRNMWKLRSIMTPQTLQQWTFHHVPLFATRAADVTKAIVEAAKRGVTIYERP